MIFTTEQKEGVNIIGEMILNHTHSQGVAWPQHEEMAWLHAESILLTRVRRNRGNKSERSRRVEDIGAIEKVGRILLHGFKINIISVSFWVIAREEDRTTL